MALLVFAGLGLASCGGGNSSGGGGGGGVTLHDHGIGERPGGINHTEPQRKANFGRAVTGTWRDGLNCRAIASSDLLV